MRAPWYDFVKFCLFLLFLPSLGYFGVLERVEGSDTQLGLY